MFRKNGSPKIIVTLLLLLGNLCVHAQSFPTQFEWKKCFGWDSWYGDEGSKIISLQDGNYFTLGKKTYNGHEAVWSSKMNSKGEILWETSIFDNNSYTGFRAIDAIQSPDGSCILLGRITNYDKLRFNYTNGRDVISVQQKGNYDVLVVKLNNQGKMVWFKIFGGDGEDIPVKILNAPNNQYLLLATTGSNNGDIADSGKNTNGYNQDLWLAKLDANGAILSKKCIGGSGDEIGQDMKPTSDGGFIVVGSTTSNDSGISPNRGGKDVLAVKIDGSTNVTWKKTFGGTQGDNAGRAISQPNGDIILGITSNSSNNDFLFTPSSAFPDNYEENIWLFKLNSNGSLQNKKMFGGSGRDVLNDLILNQDGNYTLIGSTKSNNGNIQDRNRIPSNNNDKYDVVLMKISNRLDFIWEKTIGGSADDEGNSLVETNEGTYIAIGTTQSFDGDVTGNHYNSQDSRDIWLVKLSYSCQTNITTSANLVSVNTDIKASQTITTSDNVSDNSSIHYGAGKSIEIAPGFNSDIGSTIEFNLDGCSNTGGGTNNNPIQIKVNNECREGGMKFKFAPFTPNTDLSQYRMSIQNLDPAIEFAFSGNTLITKNNIPDNGNAYFLLTVSRDGYEDFSYQGYTSTCEHDNAPINCPENNNDVILDKNYYQVGETFTATWTGTLLPTQDLAWYNSNISTISQSGNTFTGKIIAFPASMQAQPDPLLNGSRPCHGATRVEFRQVK